MKEKKKIISVELPAGASFYDYLDELTPEQVCERMQKLRAGYPDRDIYFNVKSYGYDGGLELELWERREETDREFRQRVAKEKAQQKILEKSEARKKAKELAVYERLKKKYG